LEFQGFVTAANNLFTEFENAEAYAETLTPIGIITPQTYVCSLNTDELYGYYEVTPAPEVTELCRSNFTAYLAANQNFFSRKFRTQAEAINHEILIIAEYPDAFTRVRSQGFFCENGTYILYWFVENII
jgi:hypothetical protein